MAADRGLSELALKFIVDSTAIANEFVFLNLWIISPAVPPGTRQTDLLASSLLTAAVYGVLEPALTRLLLWSNIRPWILLLALSPSRILDRRLVDGASSRPFVRKPQDVEAAEGNTPRSSKKELTSTGGGWEWPITLIFGSLSAAALNASLLLFAQELNRPFQAPQILGWYAVLWFGVSHLRDYWIARESSRAWHVGQSVDRSKLWRSQLASLAVLLVVKAAIRAALGLDPFMAFRPTAVADIYKTSSGRPVTSSDPSGTRFWQWFALGLAVLGGAVGGIASSMLTRED